MRGAGLISSIMAAAATLLGAPAQAAWLQATSRHFVVYANETPDNIKQRVEDLEACDAALRRLHHTGEGDDAEANRLTVYVTRDMAQLTDIYGSTGVAGFYLPRAGGSVAFTPREGDGLGFATDLTPQVVLFHEYAHHFLLANYAMAYPVWFSEGYAEFVSTMKIDPDKIIIGMAANHRAYGVSATDGLQLASILAPPRKMDEIDRETIYARGWVLTHYLMLEPNRAGQLEKYLRAFNAGTPSLAAAQQSFGDLRALDHDLHAYVHRPNLPGIALDRGKLSTVTVSIRPLSDGETALIDARMMSARGVNKKNAGRLADSGNKAAARYPDDAIVQGWVAEMAFDAGRLDAAEKAADRALALDPHQSQGLLYKARVRMQRLADAKPAIADWRAARSYIVRANQLAANDAGALTLFYQSYLAEGKPPTPNAIAALVRAQELNPQAPDVRMALVRQYIRDGNIPAARRLLLPLAYDPHAGADTLERKLLAAIDAKADQSALNAMLDGSTAASALEKR